MMNLNNKVILITGGYGYLGKEISLGLAKHGAKVVVLARSKEKFDTAFKKQDNIFFVHCDVGSTISVINAFSIAHKQFGSINCLINNAFFADGQNPLGITDEQFAHTMDGIIGNVYRCVREIVPYFDKKHACKIINVSSMYGMVAPDFDVYKNAPEFLNPPHYGIGKAGLIQLTKYFASFLGKQNIQVNAISPGAFPSEEVQANSRFIKALEEKNVLKRIGRPQDLIGAFVLLASDYSDYITGQNIVIDGGWTIT